MSTNEIVPFGKYKGQPLEVIAHDREYCEWLLTQAWFVEKFPQIHTVVINNFGEPSETPEHNALQMRLLDDEFRAKCTEVALQFFYPERLWEHEVPEGHKGLMYLSTPVFGLDDPPTFEDAGIDVTWQAQQWMIVHDTRPQKRTLPDTHSSRWMENGRTTIALECKPLIGDDFPAILRFLKNLPRRLNTALRMVLAGDIRSQTVPLAAIKQFFATSNVALVLVDEVEAAQPLWGPGCPAQELAHRAYMLPRDGTSSLRCSECGTVPEHAVPYSAPVLAHRLFEVLRAYVSEKAIGGKNWDLWTPLHRALVSVGNTSLALDAERFVLGTHCQDDLECLRKPESLRCLEDATQAILGYALRVEVQEIAADGSHV